MYLRKQIHFHLEIHYQSIQKIFFDAIKIFRDIFFSQTDTYTVSIKKYL
jgi:hypothetical protein